LVLALCIENTTSNVLLFYVPIHWKKRKVPWTTRKNEYAGVQGEMAYKYPTATRSTMTILSRTTDILKKRWNWFVKPKKY
jgi:hypothetical protein